MTLSALKTIIRNVCLDHKDIKSFDFGENYDISVTGDYTYPVAFMELPYLVNYAIPNNKRKTVNFALNILINTPADDKDADHDAISDAEVIGDEIIATLQKDYKQELFFDTISAASLREFSDDDVAGMRFEFIITTTRECE